MPNNKIFKGELKKLLSEQKKCSDMFILVGEINLSIIASSILIIENKLKALNYSKALVSRSKLISIELLDNILKHSAKNDEYKPFFQILIYNDKVKFISGNCIDQKHYRILNERLNELSTLKPQDVKQEYMRKLKNNELDSDGNAGLGLLTIMKKDKIKFEYDLIKLPNNYYFYENTINLLKVN